MGYVDRNLVPGETLLYRTRHHWLVLMGPFFGGLLLLVPGIALMAEAIATRDSAGLAVGSATISPKVMVVSGVVLAAAAIITFSYGVAQRNGNGGNQPPRADQDRDDQPAHTGPDAFAGGEHWRGRDRSGKNAGLWLGGGARHGRHPRAIFDDRPPAGVPSRGAGTDWVSAGPGAGSHLLARPLWGPDLRR